MLEAEASYFATDYTALIMQ